MEFLMMVPYFLTLSLLLGYPLWLFLFEWFSTDDGGVRNKMRAAHLVLFEYQMVETINAMREQVGKPSIDYKPVLVRFDDRGWEIVRVKCRQMVLGAVRKLAWMRSES